MAKHGLCVNGMISTSAESTKNGCQVNSAAHHAADHEDHVSDHKVLTNMAKKLYHVRKALNQISKEIFDSRTAPSHTRKEQTERDFILHKESLPSH
jgi:predicted site-specific integrase-resolvase